MFLFKSTNNGTLSVNDKSAILNTQQTAIFNETWLELSQVESHTELSDQYANICHKHTQQNKWVLIINPEEQSLEQLASTHGVDISKVLCVSFKGKNKTNNLLDEKSAHLDIEQIKSVLCRGNCSAVILSNASFNQGEMNQLSESAQVGETHCILLSNKRRNETTFSHPNIH